MKTPDKVRSLELEGDCTSISQWKWSRWMDGATRADKRKIDRLVKEHLPYVYNKLDLEAYNPYNYYKTERHLILVHSSIEYFLTYEL